MIRRPPRSTQSRSSAASDVYKRQVVAIRPDGTEPNSPGWQIRVVPNKFPAFEAGEKTKESSEMFPRRGADGAHEVIIHTPVHDKDLAIMTVEEVALVLRVYRQRYSANSEDPCLLYTSPSPRDD